MEVAPRYNVDSVDNIDTVDTIDTVRHCSMFDTVDMTYNE